MQITYHRNANKRKCVCGSKYHENKICKLQNDRNHFVKSELENLKYKEIYLISVLVRVAAIETSDDNCAS